MDYMSLLSMLGSSGSSSGAGTSAMGSLAGSLGAKGGAASAAGGISPWGAVIQAINETVTGMGKEFTKQQEEKNNVPLLNAGKYGQKNASGSNANLDNSLDESARKVAGIGEGGATPQLQSTQKGDTLLGSLGSSFIDWLRRNGQGGS